MKIRNYHIDTSTKEPVIITWSRNYASLLASFGFIIKVEGEFINIYREFTDNNKKNKTFVNRVHKNDIVNFLKKQGANLVLGKHRKKKRNLSFSNYNEWRSFNY